MTRKDYELIARVVHSIDAKDNTREYVAELFADALKPANANFDRGRFLMACGVEGSQ